jgi:hypothetical protein
VFTGEYRHTVDAKGRLAVPSKFRAQLAGGAVVSRWLDLCLAIWPRDGWERLASKVAALPIVENPGARAFSRFVFASAWKTRVAGWIRPARPGRRGTTRSTSEANASAVVTGATRRASTTARAMRRACGSSP